ncbi:MAG: YfiR family protein [Bryobacterales bacterium]|nr:YfiR family protein [Bryobacterales bacterium]
MRSLAVLLLASLLWPAKGVVATSATQFPDPAFMGLLELIHWPGSPLPGQRLIVGVAGFAGVHPATVVSPGHRLVEFRRVSVIGEMKACHVVVFGRILSSEMPAMLQALQADRVLTVAAVPGFARRGGLVELISAPGRRKITLNSAAARQAGFRIHPTLMRVADFLPRE